ncbi:phosphatidylinositol phosphatase PTPRQ-like [Dysidea avara]|uniref:phosphatidylinositol phosphatase PTPRQ-like n=1 Tax=Dysidea avara TaxID=196820 RepID=UPI0033251976
MTAFQQAYWLHAPEHPQNVTALPINSTTIQINWVVPTVTNGIVRYYIVVYRIDSNTDLMELNSTNTTALVTGLTPFTFYTLHVLAVTVARGEASENVTVQTNEAAPSAPLDITAFNVSSTSINVTWQPPMIPNGIVRSYRVVYTTGSTAADVTTTNTSVVIAMLEIFTTYQVQVFATTVAEGDGSNIVMVTTDEDTPGPPGDLFVNEINSTAIVVTWEEPGITNGIITLYEILYSVGNVTTVSDNDNSVIVGITTNTSYRHVIGGLDPYTMYTVVIRTYTRIGAGDLTVF